MTLTIADISSAQAGISIRQLRLEGVDGVVIKATGGTEYVNPFFPAMLSEALAENMAVGLYHYFGEVSYPVRDGGYAEFLHYKRTIFPYLRDGIVLANDIEDKYPPHITASLNDQIEAWRAACVSELQTDPLGYVGTYFWRENHLDVSRYRLWLPSWQEEIPGPQYYEQHTHVTMWQYTSSATKAGRRIDLSTFYGTREDWDAMGYQSVTPVTLGHPAWYTEPYGPWRLWIHQYFHAAYVPDDWGEPIGPAFLYSDGIVRQAFKNGIWGSNGRGEPRPEAAGFALATLSNQTLGTVVADYPDVHPLR